MAPVENALDTCQVCPSFREEINSHLSRFVDLYEHLKVKQQLQTGFVVCTELRSCIFDT